MRIEPVFAEQKFSGSAFQVTENSFLTCRHVTGDSPRDGMPASESGLRVGSARLRVEQVIRSSTEDLALLILKQPQALDILSFSGQWDIGEVSAYGFEDPPGDHCKRDGPFSLSSRHVFDTTHSRVSFHSGLPQGFSGGPVIGTFNKADYCVAMNFMGGTGYGISVLILASRCVAFIREHFPDACTIVDLDMEALRIFLEHENAAMIRKQRQGEVSEFSVMCSHRFSRYKLDASTQSHSINRAAIQKITSGLSPDRVALEVDGLELARYLEANPDSDCVADTLCNLLTHKRGVKLSRSAALNAILLSGGSSVVIHGHSEAYLGHHFPTVERFKRLIMAQL